MILQLQSNTQKQLTAAEVEMIVRRILDPELAALRSTMEGDKNEAYVLQVATLAFSRNVWHYEDARIDSMLKNNDHTCLSCNMLMLLKFQI